MTQRHLNDASAGELACGEAPTVWNGTGSSPSPSAPMPWMKTPFDVDNTRMRAADWAYDDGLTFYD